MKSKGEIMQKRIAAVAVLTMLLGAACAAQMSEDQSKRPSPPASASCDLGSGKAIKTDYSSPRLKGRKMIGGQDPYDKVWRTGANEATTFVTSADIQVGGKNVPAGSYTIFTVPNPDKWTLIISKATGEWGTDYPGADKDLTRVDMKVSKLPSPVENFTIAYDKTGSGCNMRLDWDTTRASVDIAAK
jgi:Protein of unknown function (DUF2911)